MSNIGGRIVKPLLIADPANKLTAWCIKPYPQARGITLQQEAFNRSLSGARVVIEQAFGLLKGRWRCLLNKLDESVDKVPSTIITCCILHNICSNLNDDTEFEAVNDGNGNNALPLQGHANREMEQGYEITFWTCYSESFYYIYAVISP